MPRRTTSLKYAAARQTTIIAALVAGAWLGVYVLFTQVYPDDTVVGSAYRYRDDGLVTLSHARGLADVGTVSVSVSGSRVEGYSAPLQFAAASAFYGLGGDGYRGPPTPSSSAQAADHLRCISERRSATLR